MTLQEEMTRMTELEPRYKDRRFSFLKAHRAEVKSMLLTEYNEARQMELFKEEGRQEGRLEERNVFRALAVKLTSLGRSDEIARAAMDPEYCDKLFKEFRLA